MGELGIENQGSKDARTDGKAPAEKQAAEDRNPLSWNEIFGKCSQGFPNPGGFTWSEEDFNTLVDEFKNGTLKGASLDTTITVQGITSILAKGADKDCSGTLTREELESAKDSSDNKSVKDFIDHVLKNYDKIASFAKSDWSEIKDPKTRGLVEKYLKDSTPDNVISVKDLEGLRKMSESSVHGHFGILDTAYSEAQDKDRESLMSNPIKLVADWYKEKTSYHDYLKFKSEIDKQVERRKEILDWK